MRNSLLIAGAGALLLAAPVLAKPGGGNGGGGGQKGGGGPAKVERGGGGGSPQARGNGGGNGGGKARAEQRQVRAERPQKADRRPVREARAGRQRGPDRVRDGRGSRAETPVREARKQQGGKGQRLEARGRQAEEVRLTSGRDRSDFGASTFRAAGVRGACPPGLAAKNNGCLPPGQARKMMGAVAPVALLGATLPSLYQSWYPDDPDYYYRTGDGYVYRIDRDRNLVDGFFPLYDDYTGGYYVGAEYPDEYLGTYNVPVQYRPWYADDAEEYYRYGDGAIYQVDRQGGLIESIVSLLAGDLAVGQPLPAGYDVYNVPYDYRDRYADTQDNWYRYNDGQIYEVDPTTRLVQAIVETLV
jgi:hypothetical protein